MMNTVCSKCGQSIKNVYTFEGKPYGFDCVMNVSGLRSWEVRSSFGNIDEYKQKAAEQAAKNKKFMADHNEMIAENREKNAWLIGFLESLIKPEASDFKVFLTDMIFQLERKDINQLSDRQFDSLKNIYTKGLKGLEKGLAEVEFIFATGSEDINEQEALQEAKYYALSFATLKELKELAKQHKVKGYSKMQREEIEDNLIEYINL